MKLSKLLLVSLVIVVVVAAVKMLVFSKEKLPQQYMLEKMGVKKAIIFNGDDLGLATPYNDGIFKSFDEGILTTSTLLTPAPGRNEAIRQIKSRPGIDIGVHLVLIRAVPRKQPEEFGPISPVSMVPTLVNSKGMFPTLLRYMEEDDKSQVETELTAQVRYALDHGVDVTHLDCHKFFCSKYPDIMDAFLTVAARFDLPVRWEGEAFDPRLEKKHILAPDHFITLRARSFDYKKKQLLEIINNLDDGISEIMLHPSTTGELQTADMQLMLDPDIKAAIDKQGIKLMGYRELRDLQRNMNSGNHD